MNGGTLGACSVLTSSEARTLDSCSCVPESTQTCDEVYSN